MSLFQSTYLAAFTLGFLLAVFSGWSLVSWTALADEAACQVHWSKSVGDSAAGTIFPDNCSNPFAADDTLLSEFALVVGGTSLEVGESIMLPAAATSTTVTLTVLNPRPDFLTYYLHVFQAEAGVYTEVARGSVVQNEYEDITVSVPLTEESTQYYHAVVSFEERPMWVQERPSSWFARLRARVLPTVHAIYRGGFMAPAHIPFVLQRAEDADPEDETDPPTPPEDPADEGDNGDNNEDDTAEAEDAEQDPKDPEDPPDESDQAEDTDPTRASNVLFLPGIQASRLFVAEDISTGLFSGYNAGDRVWEPGRNRDVRMLEMSSAGTPMYSLYSDQILDTITFGQSLQIPISDVYVGISSFFDQLVEEEAITQWYPYAYDWRYSVSDIAERGSIINQSGTRQSLTDTARALAVSSHTGQVTIVAHSNGGLLAKALIDELEAAGDAELVDTLVMIGVPQTGSPKAIASILHGYDQQLLRGLIVRARLARELLNNFPAVYSLLPSARFIEDSDQSVITFDVSPSTQTYREAYDTSIDGYTELRDFLLGTETAGGRDMSSSLYVPARANSALLHSAWSEKERLSNWNAPEHMRIVELVGVGLPTPISLRYEDTLGDVCDPIPTATICLTANMPRPFFNYSLLGDETVPGVSAGAYRGNKELYYINLSDKKYSHANITEVPSLSEMLENILKKREMTTLPNHFSVALFDFKNTFTIKRVASPVNIMVTDDRGNLTGVVETAEGQVIKMEIPGSWYDELGGVKKVMIPSEIEHTTTLSGTATGTFTYFSDTISTHDTERDLSLYQASTTPQMVATYRSNQFGPTTLEIDLTGDGIVEAVYDWDEGVLELLEVVAQETHEILRPGVRRQGSVIQQPSGVVAGMVTADLTPEQLSQLFDALVQLQLIINQLSESYGNK